jgi:molybdenum cofactor cytidylyltransferase
VNICQVKPEIALVILAAGESRRFGSPKQLADWFGEPLLLATLKLVESCAYAPYLALGANRDRICAHPSILGYADQVIPVDDWHAGISASIVASVKVLVGKSVHGVIFLLADQPLISPAYLKRLIAEAQKFPDQLIATAYDLRSGECGVPAYFPEACFDKLLALQPGQGAKQILKSGKTRILSPEINLSIKDHLLDIDEPDDLVRARMIYCKQSKS